MTLPAQQNRHRVDYHHECQALHPGTMVRKHLLLAVQIDDAGRHTMTAVYATEERQAD